MTRQRVAVTRALDQAEGFQSAQALHDVMRRAGDSIGLTTVYRHLQALADAGEIDVLRTADGESAYRRCRAEEHHHHLVCRGCGTTVEVTASAVEAWAEQVGRKHGFRDVSHTVEVFGTCRTCR